MKLDIAFKRAYQKLATVSQLVDFPVTVLLSDLNHTLFPEFLEMCVDVATAQVERLSQVIAIRRFFPNRPQDLEFRVRDETHFSEKSDSQRLKTVNGISESQQNQTSQKSIVSGDGIEDHQMSIQPSRRKFLGLSVTALSLSVAGCASEQGTGGQPDETQQTPTWRDKVNSWLDNHEPKEKEALSHFNDGTDAYENGDYSRAYMHFQKARKRYDDLNKAAESKANEYDEGTNLRESFLLLTQYYWRMMQASAARENAAFAMPDNPTKADAQLGRASDHLEVANQRKEKFRDMLNYETATDG